MEQSDFAQHFQLQSINPSGVLADTTSLTGSPAKPSVSTRKGYAASVAQQSC